MVRLCSQVVKLVWYVLLDDGMS